MTPVLRSAEAIGQEISRRLALCTQAQGAETDLGAAVYRGRRHVDDSMIPCAAIIESKDVPQRMEVLTSAALTQHYYLLAYVPCDPANPNDAAHAAIRDLKRTLFNTDGSPSSNWGRAVKQVEYVGRDIGPRADGAAFVVAAVEVAVHYVENLAAP